MPTTEVRFIYVYIRVSSNKLQARNSKEKDKKDAVLLNRQSVLDEIERLGTGLVKKIIVREK